MKELLDEKENVGVLYDVEKVLVRTTSGGQGDEMECSVYILNNFHDHLLDKPMLSDYTDEGLYVPKLNRAPNKGDYVKQVKKMNGLKVKSLLLVVGGVFL